MKRILKRSPLVRRMAGVMSRVLGRNPVIRRDEVRALRLVGDIEGGWRIDPAELGLSPLVCSIGIGDDATFDLEMLKSYGARIMAFDPSPGAGDSLAAAAGPDAAVEFHRVAVSGFDGTGWFRPQLSRGRRNGCWTLSRARPQCDDAIQVEVVSIARVLTRLSVRCPDLLKIDAEGSEYEIIRDLAAVPRLPRQLLVEFHHRFPGRTPCDTLESVRVLRSLGYRLAGISELGCEYTFIRADGEHAPT